MKKIYIRNTP